MHVGIGYDIHALKKGLPLILGGVSIPFPKGLVGHSDADALYHAICDAIFGAAGTGDIGDHFPDSDPRFKGAPSAVFARKARSVLKAKGFKILFIDAIIVAEAPKLFDFKTKMKKNIAKDFGVSPACVGLKAKTNEGFGAVGRNEAILCQAAVTVGRATRAKR